MYSVIDLFAGAGGLSLGFQQTGEYDIKVAYENNPNMQETYKKNHPGVDVRGDVCSADYSDIKKQYGDIDVVIGGPPCQGFSNANRQKNHVISKNNMLVKQYIRAIVELSPKAFIMENVSMLKSDVHRFYLDKNDVSLVLTYDIPTEITKIVLLEEQFIFPEALSLIQDSKLLKEYLWNEEKYKIINVVYKSFKNAQKTQTALEKHKKKILEYAKSYSDSNGIILKKEKELFDAFVNYYSHGEKLVKLQTLIQPVVMIQRMLSRANEIYENDLVIERFSCEKDLCVEIKSYAVFDYIKAVLGSHPNDYVIDSRVLCAADFGAPQKRMRFVVMGIRKPLSEEVKLPEGTFAPENYRTVYDAISDLESVPTVKDLREDLGTKLRKKTKLCDLAKELRNTDILFNHIVTDTRENAMERFKVLKQGENFHSLSESLKTNTYTDVKRTQNTIYLRLDYKQPSGTVVNVRKSMWIHPILDRAVSVREAARLQTFPDSFVFCGNKDKQYQQVGNAVPPIMAKAIALNLLRYLDRKKN